MLSLTAQTVRFNGNRDERPPGSDECPTVGIYVPDPAVSRTLYRRFPLKWFCEATLFNLHPLGTKLPCEIRNL
jgi:hypothetical protein